MQPTIAVTIACFNEEPTIGKVVDDFRRALPHAEIYVFDNMSADRSAEIAAAHGATVRRVKLRGKGQVVVRMMESVPADVHVMVDADDTYPAEAVEQLLRPILDEQADMVVGTRLGDYGDRAFRPLHVVGNRLVRGLVNLLFRCRLTDVMSGYRAYTAELARNVPVTAVGFEVETELTLQSLHHGFVIKEVPIHYRRRPAGSQSKLRTFHDGSRVLRTIFSVFRSAKPLTFYGILAILSLLGGVLCCLPAVVEYYTQGRAKSFFLLFAGAALVIAALALAAVGEVLQAVNARLKEIASLMRKAAGPRKHS